ncbi:acyl-CoA dehydrogenase family protein [Amycolatopsis thermoflava]|uniref:acyl-CoA dehydrogenase family protein n=1 Tax=Amycolatopsis thermoflava TaxID=84480 RepID=UPI003802BD0A
MRSDLDDLRALVADILSREPESLWDTLGELGLTTVGIPETRGGAGGGLAELATVAAALAEHGVNVPLIDFNTGRWAAGDTVAGEVTVGRVRTADSPVLAAWARSATHLVLLVDGAERARLIDLGAPGVRVTDAGNPLDEHVDRVTVPDFAAAEPVSGPGAECIRTRLGILRSAALVGATRGAYRLTRKYLREREQFGKPLVRIPSAATALAAMRVEVIQAETALERALEADTAGAAAVARVVAGQAASAVARSAHQLHGAMGITREYPLHRLTRLLWAWRDADAPEADWAARLADRAIEGGEQFMWEDLTATV